MVIFVDSLFLSHALLNSKDILFGFLAAYDEITITVSVLS